MRNPIARKDKPWPPPTISRPQLLSGGKDDDFRNLVDNMVRFAGVLQTIREGLARHMGVTPPQYSMLMHLARCEAGELTTSKLAASLGVTVAFVVTESNKLSAQGLIGRRRNPKDARSVLLCLTDEGRRKIDDAAPMICRVNDRLFAPLTREKMRALAQTNAALLDCSDAAIAVLGHAAPAST